MNFKSFEKWAHTDPHQLFKVDALGAILSAFLLSIVLVHFQSLVGIPIQTLYILAVLPIFFAVYDLYCIVNIDKHLATCLKGIAFLNTAYCVLSIGFAIHHNEVITLLGWIYIIVEIIIVLSIAFIEYKAADNYSHENN